MFYTWFERYVNFEFYKTDYQFRLRQARFERYVNFEFYKTKAVATSSKPSLRDM